MSIKAKNKLLYKHMTQEDEHTIRRALLTAERGFEYPLDEGHERQEDGWYPLYDTIRMTKRAAYELLRLKAENLRLKGQLAEAYALRIGRMYDIIQDD